MCGRYIIFTSEEYKEMKAILKEISNRYKIGTGILKQNEIFPSSEVPAVLSSGSEPEYNMLQWGFNLNSSKKLVINARSETIETRRMFRHLLNSRRCLLPANGFFEWKENQKYFIRPTEYTTFYMAGLYNSFGKAVIITTAANTDMLKIHDRMPVIFNKETGRRWLQQYDSSLLVPYRHSLEIKKAAAGGNG